MVARRVAIEQSHLRAARDVGELVLEDLTGAVVLQAQQPRRLDRCDLALEAVVAEPEAAADARIEPALDEPDAEFLRFDDRAPHPLGRVRIDAHVFHGEAAY